MAKWIREKIELPDDLTPRQREAVAEETLRFIRERTSKGQGRGGKSFPGYNKEYIQSLDFKNAEKNQKVNLKLSGDMMAAMDVISVKKKNLLYGFENGTEENARAEGNITGSYGRKKPDAKKARDFLGLTQKEIDIILERAGIGK